MGAEAELGQYGAVGLGILLIGFCGYLVKLHFDYLEKQRIADTQRTEQYMQTMEKVSGAIDRNTGAIASLERVIDHTEERLSNQIRGYYDNPRGDKLSAKDR